MNNNGYNGLFTGSLKAEQAKNDLLVAEKLNAFVGQKRKEDEESSKAMAAMQAEIDKQTSELLTYDRKKINEIRNSSFGILKNQIAAHGGNLTRFRQNGGAAIMEQYKSSILNSDAHLNYVENKKNMATILELEKTGKAHLINPIDRANLDNYRRNKGGQITYTGQLMQVELPDGKNYDWNTNAPAYDILYHGDNKAKLMANYALSFPTLGQPTEQELISYVRSLYSVRGNNYQRGHEIRQMDQKDRSLSQEDRRIDLAERDQKFKEYISIEDLNLRKDDQLFNQEMKLMEIMNQNVLGNTKADGTSASPVETFSTNVANLNEVLDDGKTTIADWQSGKVWKKADTPEDQGGHAAESSEMAYTPFPKNLRSSNYGLANSGSAMQPNNARFINNFDSTAAAKAALNGKYQVENGVVKGIVTKNENFFGADGRVISTSAGSMYNFRSGSKPRDFKIKGVASVATFIDGNGKENIVMDEYGMFGGKNEKYTKKLNERVKAGATNVKMKQVVVLHSEDGELIYAPLNMNDVNVRQRYANENPSNNIQSERNTMRTTKVNQAKKRTEAQQQANLNKDTFISYLNDQASNKKIKQQTLTVAHQGRTAAVVSFYAALASQAQDPTMYAGFVDSNQFQKLVDEYNLYGLMKSNKSDQEVIRELQKLDKVNGPEFYDKWILAYQNFKNNK